MLPTYLGGVPLNDATLNTPYLNSIPSSEQPQYPGALDLEKRIENIIRCNAMAMVLQYDSRVIAMPAPCRPMQVGASLVARRARRMQGVPAERPGQLDKNAGAIMASFWASRACQSNEGA